MNVTVPLARSVRHGGTGYGRDRRGEREVGGRVGRVDTGQVVGQRLEGDGRADDRQRGVRLGDRRDEAGVDDEPITETVRLAIVGLATRPSLTP